MLILELATVVLQYARLILAMISLRDTQIEPHDFLIFNSSQFTQTPLEISNVIVYRGDKTPP